MTRSFSLLLIAIAAAALLVPPWRFTNRSSHGHLQQHVAPYSFVLSPPHADSPDFVEIDVTRYIVQVFVGGVVSALLWVTLRHRSTGAASIAAFLLYYWRTIACALVLIGCIVGAVCYWRWNAARATRAAANLAAVQPLLELTPPTPKPTAPPFTWKQVTNHRDYKALSREHRLQTVDIYAALVRSYLLSLPDADSHLVDESINEFTRKARAEIDNDETNRLDPLRNYASPSSDAEQVRRYIEAWKNNRQPDPP